MVKKKPIIVVCASASTYDRVITLSNELLGMGLTIALPATAERMKLAGAANVEVVTNWHSRRDGYFYKEKVMRDHLALIGKGDAILVANYEKKGKPNYIGGNVLMEMTVAFYLKKPIFILNSTPVDSPLIDEILGMQPTILHGDMSKLLTLV